MSVKKIQKYQKIVVKRGHSYAWLFFIFIAPFCAESAILNDQYNDSIISLFFYKICVFYIVPILLMLLLIDSRKEARFLNCKISAFILGICLYLALYYTRAFYQITQSFYFIVACLIIVLMLVLFLIPVVAIMLFVSIVSIYLMPNFFDLLISATTLAALITLPFMPFALLSMSTLFYLELKKQYKEVQLWGYLFLGLVFALAIYGAIPSKKYSNAEESIYKYRDLA